MTDSPAIRTSLVSQRSNDSVINTYPLNSGAFMRMISGNEG
jgi:hypothetical protein